MNTTYSGADFSECRRYRYRLWRQWAGVGKTVGYIMLNPSTADAHLDDSTITRCRTRASNMGAAGIVVVNLFAFRATKPADLLAADDPVGPLNDAAIRRAFAECDTVIAAWGAHGGHRDRDREVLALATKPLHALRLTKAGHPGHPLYIGYDVEPFVWKEARP